MSYYETYCEHKAWFATEAEAKAELARIRAKRVPQSWQTPTRAYPCGCGGWHLTSKPLREETQR